MNVFEGVELNTAQFFWPIVILIAMMIGTTLLFHLLFKWLPRGVYNIFIGLAALFGAYIWAVPLNLGFYELFK
ncbi:MULTISPECIES: hypothetical protein [Bacillus]|uniref:hypothetical protein n=1 Tax=Bacillus TaxID=1386 RepID=UPI000C776D82|nr:MULTISPECIES: hypothetical protein [Bacillus]MCP1161238.1 hypothetical protein [Bacillus infantis]PLR70560.1 hypothetical protein CYJ37_23815 [Bacillus sp. UMB0728]